MSAVIKDPTPAHQKPLVALCNLNKHYGDFAAVDDISLEIQDGEFLTFLGSSGSGKSTTLSMLAGFETPSSGEILVSGKSLVNVPPHKRDIGMVFQRYSLFPHLSVRDNIAFPLAIRKLPAAEREKKVDAMLKLVQLEAFAHRRPSQLSGGQQQRVAIARALALDTKVLLFDEPTSALDPELVGEVLDVIKGLTQLGVTLVVVTHEIGFAREVADHVVFLCDGQLIEQGPPEQVFRQPRHPRTAAFLGKVL